MTGYSINMLQTLSLLRKDRGRVQSTARRKNVWAQQMADRVVPASFAIMPESGIFILPGVTILHDRQGRTVILSFAYV
jgi:hypothetical protein